MASPDLSRRVRKAVAYPPLSEMSVGQRIEKVKRSPNVSRPGGRA
jgi:hypothetical protein